MIDNSSDHIQNQKILGQYEKDGYLDKETTDEMMRLKKKIEYSNYTSVISSRFVIKSLSEDKLSKAEKDVIKKFESLIDGCSDAELLNDIQSNAFEDVKDIQSKYIHKD
jgi:hypothetical protein